MAHLCKRSNIVMLVRQIWIKLHRIVKIWKSRVNSLNRWSQCKFKLYLAACDCCISPKEFAQKWFCHWKRFIVWSNSWIDSSKPWWMYHVASTADLLSASGFTHRLASGFSSPWTRSKGTSTEFMTNCKFKGARKQSPAPASWDCYKCKSKYSSISLPLANSR